MYSQAPHDNQNFDKSIKNNCGELIVSTTTYNKNNFTHFLVYSHHKNPQKRFKTSKKIQKFKTTRTPLQKLAFMCKHFSNKLTKTPFSGYCLIICLNRSVCMHAKVFKNFISRKKRLYTKS